MRSVYPSPRRILLESIDRALPLALCLLVAAALAPPANATIITSLHGDMDGFGQGLPIADGLDYTDQGGAFFIDARDAGDLADAPQTDIWETGYPIDWTHDYILDGPVTSATLTFYVAGMADIGSVDLLVDGALLETFEFFPPSPNDLTHLVDVAVPLAAIDGSTAFSFANGDGGDGRIFDFAQLTVVTDTGQIPEPSSVSILLGGLAMLGLGAMRRRRRD